MPTVLDAFSDNLAAKSKAEQRAAIQDAVKTLPDDQKKALADALAANLPRPDQTTSNKVWLIIIWAFVIVMLVAVATLCTTVFTQPVKDGTKPELILTVFTTVTAFLAGLFAPSPVQREQ